MSYTGTASPVSRRPVSLIAWKRAPNSFRSPECSHPAFRDANSVWSILDPAGNSKAIRFGRSITSRSRVPISFHFSRGFASTAVDPRFAPLSRAAVFRSIT